MISVRVWYVPKRAPNANAVSDVVSLPAEKRDEVRKSWQRAFDLLSPHIPSGNFLVRYEVVK